MYRVFLDVAMPPEINNSDAMPKFLYLFPYLNQLPRQRLVSDLYRTIVGYGFK